MRITICGGNGFLGRELARFFLANTDNVLILSRRMPDIEGIEHVYWGDLADVRKALEYADVVINLAGKSVDCRYNKKNKAEIYNSRIDTTQQIKDAIKSLDKKPKVWLNASTATIYRHAADRPMTEHNGEIGHDFSMNIAKAWESAFFDDSLTEVRQVALRTSIVFGNTGGAYIPLKRLIKAGFGGEIGNGNQMVSWIHIADFCRAVDWIMAHENLSGAINVTAPNPLTNAEQMSVLRKVLGVDFGLPTPEWLLKIGAFIIQTEPELVLKSRWVLPEKLQKSGFKWKFAKFNDAVQGLVETTR
jgi:uncharacterized protein (TIGR01777 family)